MDCAFAVAPRGRGRPRKADQGQRLSLAEASDDDSADDDADLDDKSSAGRLLALPEDGAVVRRKYRKHKMHKRRSAQVGISIDS